MARRFKSFSAHDEMQEIGTPMLPGKALVAESDIES